MKRYCLIKEGEVTQIGGLPINFNNVSNFYLLSDDEIKPYGWLPIETISENKEIQENVEYVIEENVVKEIVTTRDKTQEEIENENQSQIEAKWYSARFKRNNLLKESDIEILSDKWEVMDVETKSLWSNYRKQLRDIPQIFSNSDDIIWPIKP
jgi:hypothetical protein